MFDPVGFITDYTVFFHRRDELYCMQVMMIKRIRFRVNNENIIPYFSPSSFIKCVALSITIDTVKMFWAIICYFFSRKNCLFMITYSHYMHWLFEKRFIRINFMHIVLVINELTFTDVNQFHKYFILNKLLKHFFLARLRFKLFL